MQTKVAVALCALVASTPAAARCWKPGQNVSWYGEPQKLPDGSRYDPDAETCASREHPAGTILRVVDLDTGLGVDCAVNDRGPNPWTRCRVDLSRRAAERVGMKDRGVIRARIEVVLAVWPNPSRMAQDEPKQEKGPGVAAEAF